MNLRPSGEHEPGAASAPPVRRGRRDMTESELAALLAWFDAHGGRAAEQYEAMHAKIAWFVEFHGCPSVDSADLADIVLTTVARRIASGEVVASKAYFLAVAGNVLHEYRERRLRRSQPLTPEIDVATADSPVDALIRAETARRLADAKARLAPEARALLAEYDDAESRPGGREALARRRGKSIGAIYIQVHRVRMRLRDLLGTESPGDGR
jgi:DNA-directed RNA polymerase specialized sigma24 family protein